MIPLIHIKMKLNGQTLTNCDVFFFKINCATHENRTNLKKCQSFWKSQYIRLPNNDWVLKSRKKLNKNIMYVCKTEASDHFQPIMVKYDFSKKN